MSKILTVVGATGIQGSSVVAALLNNPTYTIRGVTRNTDSDKARALAAQGVQVVQANLDDLESLKRAFDGSHAIFAVTNFFEPLALTSDIATAMRTETQQGRNLADAAAATAGLEHYIWSSLPNSSENTKGQADVCYFASKNAVDEHIRTDLPELWAKTTLVWFGWYAGNMGYPLFTPHPLANFDPSSRDVVHLINVPGGTLIPMLGSTAINPGLFVRAILEQPAVTLPGKAVAGIVEYLSVEELVASYERTRAEAAGKSPGKTHVIEVSDDKYAEMWPVWGEALGTSHRYMEALPGQCMSSVHGEIEVLHRGDLAGLEGLVTTEQAFRDMAKATAV
ncbi:uncharacterized protein B0I36DRAFT_353211 [Microdochium trichocladiopsis]|uniref:NmrA-like domain-containing protein n=1 Tax=Microdochium trichocladiopsis TaxID=1682393 RepID=A0A9P8Y1D8_9PEZI|nr:uncharacterized protein B0I36DRAFT_353211 [Microdochium trichocladiopsis]KAH7025042.1 hypothetical protein B0I36DRAFT_353211 [Microdochium trichocladiopsis]